MSLDENHGVFRKNSGMFYFIERLDRVLGEVAEKIAGTQMAIETAFNAAQAGHGHCRPSISSQKQAFAGWATIERTIFESRGRPDRALRKVTTE
ncbi:MAG TPA: hypothetical protein VE957_10130 [Terriglobales bacterium]|nr:hypothetical protein [Terriglobales bacterium]